MATPSEKAHLDISRWLVEGRLGVPIRELRRLNNVYGARACAEAVARLASEGTLSFPYKSGFMPPADVLYQNLCEVAYVETTERPYIGALAARARRTPWGFDGREVSFVVSSRAYSAVDQITDHFTEDARVAARVRGQLAPAQAWVTPEMAVVAASKAIALAFRTRRPLCPYTLREGCYEAFPECTQFKATLAAEICRFFVARRVLDPFAGWGDRAIGAAGAGVETYVGVDPNPALVPGHRRLLEFLENSCGGSSSCRIRATPFEAYSTEMFHEDFDNPPDLVVSSPPFFDYEIYSDDPSQSTRFTSLGDWLAEWFLPSTDKAWAYLAPGGHLAYYLADADGEITGPLRRHMDVAGRHFRGVIACCREGKRPLPLWVWRKDEA